ncbi:MAG TPA: hypothetical protein PLH56_01335 [Candidatus Omnitrophota bacterium]|nr:hypothetical protein [Candidatus Omnitrophota bacterium]HPN87962.1 hypothetical protein [Candidatus Omnitrophota bacterium]
MLRIKKISNNEKGVVFILVISIIMVMMILTISILSINTSQVVSTEEEVRRIQAETLAMGAMEYVVALAANGVMTDHTYASLFSKNMDGTTYNVLYSYGNSSTPPLKQINIQVNY